MSVSTALSDAPALPLRRNRNFLLLISGQIISSAGDQVQNFALLLVLMVMAGKTGQVGIVLGLNTASFLLFGVFAGAIADRRDRRRTMIWCEIGRAAATGGIAAAMWLGELHLAYLYAFADVGAARHPVPDPHADGGQPAVRQRIPRHHRAGGGRQSLGTMLGGTLIAFLGARGATLALGGWLALLAISTTLNRQARSAGG
jgi:MFS family permease